MAKVVRGFRGFDAEGRDILGNLKRAVLGDALDTRTRKDKADRMTSANDVAFLKRCW